jgi:predicted metal-binding membrane protein
MEDQMSSNDKQLGSKEIFEPLEIMGVFWLFFGLVVLLATFFVKGTENVPLMRGIVTNIIAAALLLAAGIFSILKGRANKRRRKK